MRMPLRIFLRRKMKSETRRAKTGFVGRFLGPRDSVRRSKIIFMLCVLVPIMSLYAILRIIPILSTFGLAMTNAHLIRPTMKFVGFANIQYLLGDKLFMDAFLNSLEYLGVAVPAEILLGLFFALMLSRKVRFEGFYETLYFLPYIIPMVPAAIIWRWFYSPGEFGLFNALLRSVGLPSVPWMGDPQITLLATIAIHVWKRLGFFVIIFLVALKNIPTELTDAAKVDGAGKWQTITRIEIPLIKPVILVGSIMAIIWSWAAFAEVYIMSQGTDSSAGVEISTLMFRIYQLTFVYSKPGVGAALSLILFLVSLGLVLVQFKVFKSR